MQNLSKQLKSKIIYNLVFTIGILLFTILVLYLMNHLNLVPKEYYRSKDFNIKTIYSSVDYDNDNIDDYSDFLLGARKDANNHPKYINKEYKDSYPPDNEGVAEDVIWRAFKNAGYALRDMVDNDIKKNASDYPFIKKRNKFADYRNVNVLRVFFKKYGIELTNDYKEIEEWQPGDIVFLNDNHIGMISDRRNSNGYPFIIHNNGQENREEDAILNYQITGHYRFDASKVNKDVLVKYTNE